MKFQLFENSEQLPLTGRNRKQDTTIAKNYLSVKELKQLNLVFKQYIAFGNEYAK